MTKLRLETRQVGPWGMNTYALICPDTRESVLFDPGDDPDTLQEMLVDTNPIAILLTHSHFDHVNALSEMKNRLQVPVMAHPGEHAEPITADRWLNDGDSVTVGHHTLRVFYAPGHIDDQICFAIETEGDHRIVVGDTIFDGGPGRTWSPEGFQITLKTLRQVVLPWPDDTHCYPGHGPDFRLGDRRAEIEAFLARDHGDFYGDATWEMGVG
ncbi:MAG: MBL fold metallo-hydrolase [Ardenticatenaceae bacterium]|nr:MBL fold metallo-hydrolase [Ardenticatenaceae bacterium]